MKFKNKGRKIYKTKEKNYYGKSLAGKIVSAALSLLLLGGIAFLGYSAAEPIINYTKKQGDTEEDASVSGTDFDLTETPTNLAATEEITDAVPVNAEQFRAASLLTSDLADADKLSSALKNINATENIEYISVPLKIGGGELYYASQIYDAQMCGAVKSDLTLTEIVSAISSSGYKPVAEVSMLRDNLLPQAYPDSGYKTTGDGSRWIDNDEANGGKPWLSPYSEMGSTYLSSIVTEIASAGFVKVICSDFIFPPFRESDLQILGDEVKSPERYQILTTMANNMYSNIISCGSSMMLEVSASDIVKGSAEVLQPMMLNVSTLVLNIDYNELKQGIQTPDTLYEFTGKAEENTEKLIDMIKDKLEGYNVIVKISNLRAGSAEFGEAKYVLQGYGYNSFILS